VIRVFNIGIEKVCNGWENIFCQQHSSNSNLQNFFCLWKNRKSVGLCCILNTVKVEIFRGVEIFAHHNTRHAQNSKHAINNVCNNSASIVWHIREIQNTLSSVYSVKRKQLFVQKYSLLQYDSLCQNFNQPTMNKNFSVLLSHAWFYRQPIK